MAIASGFKFTSYHLNINGEMETVYLRYKNGEVLKHEKVIFNGFCWRTCRAGGCGSLAGLSRTLKFIKKLMVIKLAEA